MTTMPSPDQRRFTRVPFAASVELEAIAGKRQCELLDVSLKGMLITLPAGSQLQIGTDLKLSLRLENSEVCIRVEATVRHIEPGRAGLTIQHVDVESAAHLRRLIELNLGDDALLHRELAAMITSS